MTSTKEAGRALAARIRAGERVVFADESRTATMWRDEAGFQFRVPHWSATMPGLIARDPGQWLDDTCAGMLYSGLEVEGVVVTWPAVPVDEWIDRIERGELLRVIGRRGPRFVLSLARTAGWYYLAEEGLEARFERTAGLLRERLALIDPACDPDADFEAYAAGLHDPFVEAGWALTFTNGDASYPWDFTVRRLASGAFELLEQTADLHDPMGGHSASETCTQVDEAAARAAVDRLLARYFPRVRPVK